jgi:oligopeptide/dipeptide ABC transporter ATP-binding protein
VNVTTQSHAGAPLLQVRHLQTHFSTDAGPVKAVEDVSFTLNAGETLAVVCESGSGKSVTSLSIMGLIPNPPGRIVGGEILFRTREGPVLDLVQLPANALRKLRGRDIAMIFQEPMTSLDPVFTVGAQIAEAAALHLGMSRHAARKRALDMLELVEIPASRQRIDEYPHQLSGGMRQRVMIAIALACRPPLVIADEPTTALDVTTQTQILDLMRRLQQEDGMAIMLITHDLGVIAEMTSEVAVMYLGRVVEQAPVDDLFHAPRHPYTQALLRSIPRIRSRPGERLNPIAGAVPHPYARPSGCPFHPRCAKFMAGTCDRQTPVLRPVGDHHTVSCFLYE